MAARTLRPRHQEDIKLKIQSSQLVNLLQNHALGNSENELKPSQLDAAKFLLNKTLSNAPTEVAQKTELYAEVNQYSWEE
jgi:hypothetical protein